MRRADRAVTDTQAIREIVEKGKILHLGLMDGNYPYIVPLHYGFSNTEDGFVFYMHGAKCGHKIDLIQKNPNAFVEIETDVLLTGTGENPCEYGSFYSSFMGRGQAEILEDVQEKKYALQLLMQNQTDRDFEFTESRVSSVAVMKVTVEHYTAKARKKI